LVTGAEFRKILGRGGGGAVAIKVLGEILKIKTKQKLIRGKRIEQKDLEKKII